MRCLPLAVCLVGLSVQAAPWALDSKGTALAVKTWKTGAGAGLAHDHIVRATKFSGSASLDDAGTAESLKLELVAEVNALTPDEPEDRRAYHLPNTPVPDSDRKKVKDTMIGDEQLDAAKFPTISFTVNKVYREESGVLQCLGKLTLHGVTKELLFPIKVKSTENKVEGEAAVKFRTSDFGVKPYSAALGLIRNKDEVELVVRVVLTR